MLTVDFATFGFPGRWVLFVLLFALIFGEFAGIWHLLSLFEREHYGQHLISL
jgi:hypothetical protein